MNWCFLGMFSGICQNLVRQGLSVHIRYLLEKAVCEARVSLLELSKRQEECSLGRKKLMTCQPSMHWERAP